MFNRAGIAALLAAWVGLAPVANAGGADEPPAANVTGVRDKLVVLNDGRDHFLALVPFGRDDDRKQVYYGDGKRLYALRIVGASASGNESFTLTFWDPRFKRGVESQVRFLNGRYTVACGERETELKALPDSGRTVVTAASFFAPLWRRRAYAMARDDRGTYFYVDKQREPEESRNFRIYSGPRGKMKRLEMINVVSDSMGEIFVTRSGKLSLIFGKDESFWIQGKKRQRLTNISVEDNSTMIYDEAGAYTGQRLGTPCDDL